MLDLHNLRLAENGVPHLDGITASFAPGTLTTILGRTGAGKTSLLRAIAGLAIPDAGEIRLDGADWRRLPPWKRPVAMVTQQFINYPHLPVLDNVAFPLVRRGEKWPAARDAARAMLDKVGLAAMVDRRPSQLSGGQQQRVAIARALVKKAPVLLLDEPFVNLDYKLREGLREELVEMLRTETGTTVLYASTEPREALQLGDRIMLMAEGRLLDAGDPRAIFERPATLEAAQVVNAPPINIVPLEIDTVAKMGPFGTQELGALGRDLAPGRYRLGLRAGDIAPGGPHRARVILTEVSGSETVTHLDLAGLPLVMHEKSVVAHAPGSEIGISARLDRGFVFAADGALISQGASHG